MKSLDRALVRCLFLWPYLILDDLKDQVKAVAKWTGRWTSYTAKKQDGKFY